MRQSGDQDHVAAHESDAAATRAQPIWTPRLNTACGSPEFDDVHLFVRTREPMREALPALVPHVTPQGKLWLSWPKGRKLGSDLTLPKVIEIGDDCGLVKSTGLRVDDIWSGLRLTHPKPGRIDANSHGTLPSQHP